MLGQGLQCIENKVTEEEDVSPILRLLIQTEKVECKEETGDWGDGSGG